VKSAPNKNDSELIKTGSVAVKAAPNQALLINPTMVQIKLHNLRRWLSLLTAMRPGGGVNQLISPNPVHLQDFGNQWICFHPFECP